MWNKQICFWVLIPVWWEIPSHSWFKGLPSVFWCCTRMWLSEKWGEPGVLHLSHRYDDFLVLHNHSLAWFSTFPRVYLKVSFQRVFSSNYKFLIRGYHTLKAFCSVANPHQYHVDLSPLQAGYTLLLPGSQVPSFLIVLEKLNLLFQIWVIFFNCILELLSIPTSSGESPTLKQGPMAETEGYFLPLSGSVT